jgi:hypothetical protein
MTNAIRKEPRATKERDRRLHQLGEKITSGWKRLHAVAVTLSPEQDVDYGSAELAEFFGVRACIEGVSYEVARRETRETYRPNHASPRGQQDRSRWRVQFNAAASQLTTKANSVRRAKRTAWAHEAVGPVESLCASTSSGAGPPGSNVGSPEKSGESERDTLSADFRRETRIDPQTSLEDGQRRWSYGSCSTEFLCEAEDSGQRVNHEDSSKRPVRPHLLRPPNRPERSSVRIKAPPCWTETALLYTSDDGVTTCHSVTLSRKRDEEAKRFTHGYIDRQSAPLANVSGRVVRSLNPSSGYQGGQAVGEKPTIRTARDGPPGKGEST